jgi:hypothetical protein
VTDFVTIGSPLAHAHLLLAKSMEELRLRQRQRELPTSPPEPEITPTKKAERRYAYRVWDGFGENKDIKLDAVHSAGLFAFTRWTNIYFSGDLAGGPITDFGSGVHNVEVQTGNRIVDHSLIAHTSYWNPKAMRATKENNAIAMLKKVLDIESFDYFRVSESDLEEQETTGKKNMATPSRRKSNRKTTAK